MVSSAISLLNEMQKRQFADFGYCVVDGLFTKAEISEIEDFFEEFKLRGGEVFDGGVPYEEVDRTKRQVRAMQPHRYSERAKGWLINPNVASVLEELLGCPALAVQTMYYFK